MYQKAFIVDSESQLYQDYFSAQEQKKKFADIGNIFLKTHELPLDKYLVAKTLIILLDDELREKYKTQLLKDKREDGLSVFKANSKLNKAWNAEVVSKIDFSTITKIKFWYAPFLNRGSYALWDFNGKLYGLLESQIEISNSKCLHEIKLSEYYSALEEAEQSDKKHA